MICSPYLVAWVRFLLLTASVMIVVLRLVMTGTMAVKWSFGLLLLLKPIEPTTEWLVRYLSLVLMMVGLAELSTIGSGMVAVTWDVSLVTLRALLCLMQLMYRLTRRVFLWDRFPVTLM